MKGSRGYLTREQSQAAVAALKAKSPDSGVLERHVAIEEALAGSPLSIGNRVTILQDGEATYEAMLGAIRAARHHVHLETYIFEADDTGRMFANALTQRARAGVKVRVMYDAVGSIKTPKEFFDSLAAAGVEVVQFNPIGKGGIDSVTQRDHRKITVVDGRVAFVGGINISDVYGASGSRPSTGDGEMDRPWRDLQTRIEGPAVADVQRAFLAQWARARKEAPIADKAYYPTLPPAGPHVVRVIAASPADEGVNATYAALISAIDSAEKEVRIMNSYFVPHAELRRALREAAQRGVDVRLILPGRSDVWLTYWAGRAYYGELLDAGVKIFERKYRVLHAKSATIDGVWATVGSTNLDWRSLAFNDEIDVVVLGPEFAGQLNRVLDRDLRASAPITREAWAKRPFDERAKEAAAKAWARWL